MSKMEIDIPQKMIEDTIRAELIRNISEQSKDKLITAVVEKALTERKDNYRGTPTFFEQAVTEMIRETAKGIFREWIESNREDISKAIYAHLNGTKQKRLKEFAEKLANNISSYGISVNIDLREDR
jgi:hypothetical protein